jgi:hypothetical protein
MLDAILTKGIIDFNNSRLSPIKSLDILEAEMDLLTKIG